MLKLSRLPAAMSALLALALLLAGCAAPPAVPSSGRGGARPAGTAAVEEGFARPPEPERPGLATGWGERRAAGITTTQFRRADAVRADAEATFFYNDRAGVEAALAQAGGPGRDATGLQPARGGFISVGLQDGGGAWLPTRETAGWAKTRHVTGEAGRRYALVVRNDTAARVEVVASVDGIDVMSGRPASLRKRGHVLAPGETYAIEGFRVSADEVAAFRFSGVAESYAARRGGGTRNVGVIGVAAFTENNSEAARRQEANPFPR
jgi:hypothetical protein